MSLLRFLNCLVRPIIGCEVHLVTFGLCVKEGQLNAHPAIIGL